MLGKTIYVNLSANIVKGIVREIVGEKFVVELEDKSFCVIVKDQIVNL